MKNILTIQLIDTISFKDKLLFTKHLSVLVNSGITILDSLYIILSQTQSSGFKKILSEMAADIQNGENLSKALAKHPKVFNRFFVSTVGIGEESGTLADNLKFLAEQLSNDYNLRKKIRGAMLYPELVLGAAAAVGLAISIFVLPSLMNVFESLGAEVPLSTKILMFTARIMQHYGVLLAFGAAIFLALFKALIQISEKARLAWHRFLLALPAYGTFLQNIQLAIFCRNLGMMLKSGMPITSALDVEFNATDNLVFKNYIRRMMLSVEKGKPLEAEMTGNSFRYLPQIAVRMIGVGEKSGKLEEVLLYLGGFFEEEVDSTAKNFSTVLEPVMLFGIGLVVAFIALAIISPIYDLTGAIKR